MSSVIQTVNHRPGKISLFLRLATWTTSLPYSFAVRHRAALSTRATSDDVKSELRYIHRPYLTWRSPRSGFVSPLSDSGSPGTRSAALALRSRERTAHCLTLPPRPLPARRTLLYHSFFKQAGRLRYLTQSALLRRCSIFLEQRRWLKTEN